MVTVMSSDQDRNLRPSCAVFVTGWS